MWYNISIQDRIFYLLITNEEIEMKNKRCFKCGETKPFQEFHNNISKKDGIAVNCKLCQKEYVWANTILKSYNVTRKQYNALFTEQEGCCKICGIHQVELKKRLGVDLDKSTGEIRGLLCGKCNAGIKSMDGLLETARNYLFQ